MTRQNGTKPKEIRDRNARLLFSLLAEQESATLNELAEMSGLSRTAVKNILTELTAEGMIGGSEKREAGKTGGKRPAAFRVSPDCGSFISLVAGSAFILGELSDFTLREKAYRYRDENGPDYSRLVAEIADVVRELLAEPDAGPLLGIAVAVSGNVDPSTGVLKDLTGRDAGNAWGHQRDLAGDLARALEYDGLIYLEGIQALSAYALYRTLPDPEASTLCVLAHRNGVASTLIENGRIRKGAHGFAGEIGHMRVDLRDRARCRCGRTGCLEAVLYPDQIRRRMGIESAEIPCTIEDVMLRAEQEDPEALAELRRIAQMFAAAIYNEQLCCDPERVIFHDAYTVSGARLFSMIEEELNDLAPGRPEVPVRLIRKTGSLPGTVREGAFQLVREKYVSGLLSGRGGGVSLEYSAGK